MLNDVGQETDHVRAIIGEDVGRDSGFVRTDSDVDAAAHPGSLFRNLGGRAGSGAFLEKVSHKVRQPNLLGPLIAVAGAGHDLDGNLRNGAVRRGGDLNPVF